MAHLNPDDYWMERREELRRMPVAPEETWWYRLMQGCVIEPDALDAVLVYDDPLDAEVIG